MRRGLGAALKFSPSFYLNSASSLRSPVKQSLHGGVQSARCILFILPKIININTFRANNLQAVEDISGLKIFRWSTECLFILTRQMSKY